MTDPKTTESEKNCGTGRGPSFTLLITGILAIVLSIWALAGPFTMPDGSALPIGWITVGAAIAVGLLMILLPRRKN